MRTLYLVFISIFMGINAYSQIKISGKITDEQNNPLSDVLIQIGEFETISDENGFYQFNSIEKENHEIHIYSDGFNELIKEINLTQNQIFNFTLSKSVMILEESVIKHSHQKNINNVETVNQEFLQAEYSGSLAKSLEKIPGIQAMEIGSGTSKPVIRGLGFNRVLVAENGIKQEGQQWGADHGLEVNPWSVEEVKIIKGAGTLEYGSDAISGVIALNNDSKPLPNSFSGDWILFGRSANQAMGSSLNLRHRKENFYYKFSASYTDFADYNIPTDHIVYLTRQIPIFNERLKNTAGNEHSASVQVGYTSTDFESVLTLSNFYQKIGFFPGAHGIPTLDRVQDDGDRRNVEFPYQNVNHFKVLIESTLRFHPNSLKFSFGFQNNHRQEWSLFHTHYGNSQQPPEIDPNLELDFNLSTFDAQVKYQHQFSRKNKLNIGVQSQSQKNSIKGYNFLLPEFTRYNLAAYITNEWEINPKWNLNYGIRFDHTQIEIRPFYDNYLYEFLSENGHSEQEANDFAQRSQHLEKSLNNINGSAGILFQPNSNLDVNLNLGSSFRVPTAIELASNGIHHGSFRHEQGNPNLDTEQGWTSDLKISYHPQGWNFELNPYFYYFSNYIFLQPSGVFSPLPHGGQIYKYSQSEAMLTGAELKIEKKFWERWNAFASVEYLYNRQITSSSSTDYPLPFSPPMVFFTEWSYELIKNKGFVKSLVISADAKIASKQDRIAQNEEITDGYTIFGAGIQSELDFNGFRANLMLTGDNLTNEKYFNHMSFYRALEIPEMGRNIQLIVRIPFGK